MPIRASGPITAKFLWRRIRCPKASQEPTRRSNLRSRFTNDDDVHQHGLLDHSAGEEFSFVDSSEILLRKTRRFEHVLEIVLQAQLTLLRVNTSSY